MRAKRLLGVPFLYSAASAAVGFSIYFSIGVVADRGLGLTPGSHGVWGVGCLVSFLVFRREGFADGQGRRGG